MLHAIYALRAMHADARVKLKFILAARSVAEAEAEWTALRPLLELHAQVEERYVYVPLAREMRPGTPLGEWTMRYPTEVAAVKQLIEAVAASKAGSPQWHLAMGRMNVALSRHVIAAEGQLFSRIQHTWREAPLSLSISRQETG